MSSLMQLRKYFTLRSEFRLEIGSINSSWNCREIQNKQRENFGVNCCEIKLKQLPANQGGEWQTTHD